MNNKKESQNNLKQYFRLGILGGISSVVAFTLPSQAASFDNLVVFGNSITDTGNVFGLTGEAFPPAPLYFEGRFSDGEVWIDRLSEDLDIDLDNFYSQNTDPTASSGLNFAVGGATTGTSSLGGSMFPGVTTQVDNYLSFLGDNTIDESTLVVLWAGENDYVESVQTQGTILNPTVPVGNIASSLTRLIDAGATNIFVPNLVNLNQVPLAQSLLPEEQVQQLAGLTAAHNSILENALSELETAFPQTNIASFDTNSLFNNLFNNPEAFGFGSDSLASCLAPNSFPNIDPNVVPCENPNEFLFFDNQHFTSRVHGLIADAAFGAIEEEFGDGGESASNTNTTTPEPGITTTLLGLGFALLYQRRKLLALRLRSRK